MTLVGNLWNWFERRRRRLDVYTFEYEYQYHLRQLWEPQVESVVVYHDALENYEPKTTGPTVRLSRKDPRALAWKIAFTAAFLKAIALADRSMQGRVLLALAELSSDPATPRGDTVKPLIGEKRGLWRYRLGDYRLVYEPQAIGRMVVLVDFAPRGSAYE